MDLRKRVLMGMTHDERITLMVKIAHLHLARIDKHVRESGLIGSEASHYRRLLLKGFKPSQARRTVEKWRT